MVGATFSQTTAPCSIRRDQLWAGHARTGRLADLRRRSAPDRSRAADAHRHGQRGRTGQRSTQRHRSSGHHGGSRDRRYHRDRRSARARPGRATTIDITAVTRGRRPARNASVCVRVPKRLSIRKPAGATLRNGRLCWRIARLAPGRRRTFLLRATAREAPCARTAALGIDVQGVGVRTRRARVLLRIRSAGPPPRQFARPSPASRTVVPGTGAAVRMDRRRGRGASRGGAGRTRLLSWSAIRGVAQPG